MKICLTHDETELLVLAGLLAAESPVPILKQDVERCTVEIVDDGVTIDVIYKEGCEPE